MRHRRAGYKLNRNATHRLALYRNLAMALFRHPEGRIITTVEKAKAVRPFVEKLITLARKATLEPEKALHARRLVLSRLGPPSNAAVKPPEGDDEIGDPTKVIVKLFDEIGPRFKDRPGGYTRIIKRHERRLGDGGKTAFLELLKEGETKVRSKPLEAPAPKVKDETEETEQPTSEPSEPQASEQSEPAADQPPAGETPPTESSAENQAKT